jgi:Tfp pilus assembly protein PilF
VSATSVQSRRSKRVRLPWIGAAAIAILLVVAIMMMIGRRDGRPGSTAQQNAEAQPFVDRAMRAKERGDVNTARRELTAALEISPSHSAALREMGTLMYGVGNFDLARNFLVRAVRADPNDSGSQQALGCALVKLGRADEGRRFLDRSGSDPRSCR